MLASAEDKAKVKEALIPYCVACVVIFGAFIIWKTTVNIGQDIIGVEYNEEDIKKVSIIFKFNKYDKDLGDVRIDVDGGSRDRFPVYWSDAIAKRVDVQILNWPGLEDDFTVQCIDFEGTYLEQFEAWLSKYGVWDEYNY